ncbi:uncharacterized protein LOC105187261 [Harpegnathos saltator]|uniref:uncharacterized protein LOC105187261 n=1 Tax=Harpegnathos saltator TaxID=610380 RepID=UPI000948E0A3|nr:uncharacterized protein LOC105187261 [Harpegnathos saltator]
MSQTYCRVKKLKKLDSNKQCDNIENYNKQSDSKVDDVDNNAQEVIFDDTEVSVTPVRINVEDDSDLFTSHRVFLVFCISCTNINLVIVSNYIHY